jgi:hypothetical protein
MRPTRTSAMKANERSCRRLKGLPVDTLCARYRLASLMVGGRGFEGDGALPLDMDVVLADEEMGESHTWRGWFNVSVTKEGQPRRPDLVLFGDTEGIAFGMACRYALTSLHQHLRAQATPLQHKNGSFGQLSIGRHDLMADGLRSAISSFTK